MQIYFTSSFKHSISYLISRNRHAPVRVFGNYEKRKNFTREEAFSHFLATWEDGMKIAVEDAIRTSLPLGYEGAQSLIADYETRYLDKTKEQRLFKYRNAPFIIQFSRPTSEEYFVDQIWYVHSHEPDPLLMCIRFETQESKNKFEELARQGGYSSGRELLEHLAESFLNRID